MRSLTNLNFLILFLIHMKHYLIEEKWAMICTLYIVNVHTSMDNTLFKYNLNAYCVMLKKEKALWTIDDTKFQVKQLNFKTNFTMIIDYVPFNFMFIIDQIFYYFIIRANSQSRFI